MQITSRRWTIVFFVVLGALSAALAIALNTIWIVHWREVGMVVLGIIFFSFIIGGLVLNTIFLVREVRRNEQHDSFINAVTHELKTPIASLRLYLETLQSRPVDEQQRAQFYRIMLDDTDRLLSTVDMVLKAAQAAQKRTRSFRPVRLGTVTRECVELARIRHHLPDAITYSERVTEGAIVYGDPDDLRSAITNLLDNAVRYTPNDPQIRVELVQENDGYEVRVIDNGVGIPAGELKRIFRRFYRVQQRVKSRVKGTGLGLFIVRSVARRHGGDAFAQSEGPEKGSTFTLRLPRIKA
ncbi:MAG TPA: HAMP domain-containing sensor histidine kinase [Candidatus Acidoferrales bacterium]|nr:HAMP domain-containing sensor histidine kinase [Candidatus Acidoferrales bacterium]